MCGRPSDGATTIRTVQFVDTWDGYMARVAAGTAEETAVLALWLPVGAWVVPTG